MAYETILFDLADGVATITFNRPEKRNAFNLQMIADTNDAVKRCERDAAVRAVIVTGAGAGFSAGQDLDVLNELDGDTSFREHLLRTYNPIVLKLRTLEKPVIAAVNGAAAGAGWGIALACDIRYAADAAKFRLAFSAIALAPDSGTSFFLPRAIGLGRALELAYTNDVLTAPDALALGLVNRVFPDSELMPATLTLAHRLAQAPTYALGLTTRAMNYALDTDLAGALDYEAYLQDTAGRGEDYREGVAAFLEKRAPRFTGK